MQKLDDLDAAPNPKPTMQRHGLFQKGDGTCLPARVSELQLSSQQSKTTLIASFRCLGDSGLPKSKISDVVLVGGSTRALAVCFLMCLFGRDSLKFVLSESLCKTQVQGKTTLLNFSAN